MKKFLQITVLLLLALNFAMPGFQSCTKENPKPDNPMSKVTLESLVNLYNIGTTLPHQKASLLEGEMTVFTLPSKEVLFFLTQAGKSTNDIFLGQGTELGSLLKKELGKVKVAYLREAMAVEMQNGEIYTFSIGVGKGHDLIQKLAPTWLGKGYGLSLNLNRTETPSNFKGLFSTDELRASICRCREKGSDDSDCTAGGKGSTDCSIGSSSNDPGCSVSCNNLNFACCKSE